MTNPQVATKPTTVAAFPGTGKQLASPVTFSPNGPEKLDEFNQLAPHLNTEFVNAPLLTTLERMISCDVLIASRSSLSACAAYLQRPEGFTIYHPFWHQVCAHLSALLCTPLCTPLHSSALLRKWLLSPSLPLAAHQMLPIDDGHVPHNNPTLEARLTACVRRFARRSGGKRQTVATRPHDA